jgi:hypothetical protein
MCPATRILHLELPMSAIPPGSAPSSRSQTLMPEAVVGWISVRESVGLTVQHLLGGCTWLWGVVYSASTGCQSSKLVARTCGSMVPGNLFDCPEIFGRISVAKLDSYGPNLLGAFVPVLSLTSVVAVH